MLDLQVKKVIAPLLSLLDQLRPDQYSQKLAVFQDQSVGQHTRHVIEFFVELQRGYETGMVDYARRERNHTLESDLDAARRLLSETISTCNHPDKSLRLRLSAEFDMKEEWVIGTSYTRELAFVLEHAIHHLALIRIGCRELDMEPLPVSFGVAPSTLAYRHQNGR